MYTNTSIGTDFFSFGRMLNKKCFKIYAWMTENNPLLAFFGERNPYGCSFYYMGK